MLIHLDRSKNHLLVEYNVVTINKHVNTQKRLETSPPSMESFKSFFD